MFLREVIGFAAHRLMELDVGELTGAAAGERSPDRLVQRNGYRDRNWQTRIGTVGPRIPKLRKGGYVPAFPEPRRMAEKALTAAIQEADVHGISSRAVDDLVRAMGMDGVGKGQAFRLCAEIDERMRDVLTRPMEGDWPYLWLDFLRRLARRGLRGVKLVVSDADEVLEAAVTNVSRATWQRCRVHFMRNAVAHAGKTQRRIVAALWTKPRTTSPPTCTSPPPPILWRVALRR